MWPYWNFVKKSHTWVGVPCMFPTLFLCSSVSTQLVAWCSSFHITWVHWVRYSVKWLSSVQKEWSRLCMTYRWSLHPPQVLLLNNHVRMVAICHAHNNALLYMTRINCVIIFHDWLFAWYAQLLGWVATSYSSLSITQAKIYAVSLIFCVTKKAIISQMTFSSSFFLNGNFRIRISTEICSKGSNWFRKWLVIKQVTSHYLH